MKCRHYAVFDNRISKQFDGTTLNRTNWDILRMDSEEGPYTIEKSANHYEEVCMKSESHKQTAEHIIALCHKLQVDNRQKVISLGAGKGVLEWHLKKLNPNLILECTDYAESSIEQLKRVFREMDAAYPFDMLEGEYSKLDIDAVFVMHRVSTEFSQEQWEQVFQKMYDAGISTIIFIPTGLDTPIDMAKEKLRYLLNMLRRRKNINCGWLYSESEFMKMFHGSGEEARYHVADKIYQNKTAVFLLERV